jgi:hypothetical protein
MPFSAYGKNKMLDNLDEAVSGGALYLSLHTAYSTTGTNEVTGGTPTYARKAATWGAAASGQKALSSALTFDVPAGSIAFIGVWDAVTVGNFIGMTPAAAGTLKMAVVNSGGVTSDTFDSPAHGFVNGNTVVPWQISGAGIPTGITEGTIYYVVGATTDTFQLSATSGGSAINITAVGKCFVQSITVEVFAAQGQYQVSAATLDLTPA